MKDYYAILLLSKNASLDDIKKAYRKLALQYHPDVNSNSKKNDAFLLITEAYQTLSNKTTKAKYDLLLMYNVNTEFKTNTEVENIHNRYREDNGRKYGTSYKYKNYTNKYREQKKKQKDIEAKEFNSMLTKTVLFVLLIIAGMFAIFFAVVDLFSFKIEGFQNVNGLTFSLLFTGLLFYFYYFVYSKK